MAGRGNELIEVLGPGEIRKEVHAEIVQGTPHRQVVTHQGVGRGREQGRAAVDHGAPTGAGLTALP